MIELAKDYICKTMGLEFESVIISPVGNSYGEKKNLLPASFRLEMCKLAAQHLPWIKVDDWESQQSTWVRTLDNLKRQESLTKENNKTHGTKVMLLCGADLITSWTKPGLWKKEDIESILKDFGILVITRKGSEEFLTHVPPDLNHLITGHLHVVEEWIPNEISSTKIRYGIKNGLSVRHLVPDPVLEFIRDRKLYETEPV